MKAVYLNGAGLFTPGFDGIERWVRGEADPSIEKPRCAIVDSRLKRGSSFFANMLGEVVEQAARAAGAEVGKVATVYGSSLGELETMVVLLEMLFREEGKLSPNRFKNSVHNAASGLVSIGSGNTSFSTAIAAGERSFEASILEGLAYLDNHGGDLVVAVADDRPPEALRGLGDHGALAVAFCFGVAPSPGAARVEDLGRDTERPELTVEVPAGLRENPASAALPLLHAFVERRAGRVPLAPLDQPGLGLSLSFEDGR